MFYYLVGFLVIPLFALVPVWEALVPSLDGECSLPFVESVPLPEQEELHAHELLQEVGSINVQLGTPINHVNSANLQNICEI